MICKSFNLTFSTFKFFKQKKSRKGEKTLPANKKAGIVLLSRRLSCSTIAASGLNCCVRDGNRCYPTAIDTNYPTKTENPYKEKQLFLSIQIIPVFYQKEFFLTEEISRPISTDKLNTLPRLHAPPINLLVSKGSRKGLSALREN